jgi:hypothetical protein
MTPGLRVKLRKLTDLKPFEDNPRQHSSAQLDMIVASSSMPSYWRGIGGIPLEFDNPWRAEREIVSEIRRTGMSVGTPDVAPSDDRYKPERYPWMNGIDGEGYAVDATRYKTPTSKAAKQQAEWEENRLLREKAKQARSDRLWDAEEIRRRKKRIEAKKRKRASQAAEARAAAELAIRDLTDRVCRDYLFIRDEVISKDDPERQEKIKQLETWRDFQLDAILSGIMKPD